MEEEKSEKKGNDTIICIEPTLFDLDFVADAITEKPSTDEPLQVGDIIRIRAGITPSGGFCCGLTTEHLGVITEIRSDNRCRIDWRPLMSHTYRTNMSDLERAKVNSIIQRQENGDEPIYSLFDRKYEFNDIFNISQCKKSNEKSNEMAVTNLDVPMDNLLFKVESLGLPYEYELSQSIEDNKTDDDNGDMQIEHTQYFKDIVEDELIFKLQSDLSKLCVKTYDYIRDNSTVIKFDLYKQYIGVNIDKIKAYIQVRDELNTKIEKDMETNDKLLVEIYDKLCVKLPSWAELSLRLTIWQIIEMIKNAKDYDKLIEYFKSLEIVFNSFTNGIMDLNVCYSQVFRDIIKPLYECFNDIIIQYNDKENGYVISTYMKWIYLRGSIIEIIHFIDTLLMTNGKHKINIYDKQEEKEEKEQKDREQILESHEIIGLLIDKMCTNILNDEDEKQNNIELFKPFELEITCECIIVLMDLITKFVSLINKSETAIALGVLKNDILNNYCQNQMVKLLELLNKICEKLVWILLNCSDDKIPKELKVNKILLQNIDTFDKLTRGKLTINSSNNKMKVVLNSLSKQFFHLTYAKLEDKFNALNDILNDMVQHKDKNVIIMTPILDEICMYLLNDDFKTCNLKDLWDKKATETQNYVVVIASIIDNIYNIINVYYNELQNITELNNLINISECIIKQIIGKIYKDLTSDDCLMDLRAFQMLEKIIKKILPICEEWLLLVDNNENIRTIIEKTFISVYDSLISLISSKIDDKADKNKKDKYENNYNKWIGNKLNSASKHALFRIFDYLITVLCRIINTNKIKQELIQSFSWNVSYMTYLILSINTTDKLETKYINLLESGIFVGGWQETKINDQEDTKYDQEDTKSNQDIKTDEIIDTTEEKQSKTIETILDIVPKNILPNLKRIENIKSDEIIIEKLRTNDSDPFYNILDTFIKKQIIPKTVLNAAPVLRCEIFISLVCKFNLEKVLISYYTNMDMKTITMPSELIKIWKHMSKIERALANVFSWNGKEKMYEFIEIIKQNIKLLNLIKPWNHDVDSSVVDVDSNVDAGIPDVNIDLYRFVHLKRNISLINVEDDANEEANIEKISNQLLKINQFVKNPLLAKTIFLKAWEKKQKKEQEKGSVMLSEDEIKDIFSPINFYCEFVMDFLLSNINTLKVYELMTCIQIEHERSLIRYNAMVNLVQILKYVSKQQANDINKILLLDNLYHLASFQFDKNDRRLLNDISTVSSKMKENIRNVYFDLITFVWKNEKMFFNQNNYIQQLFAIQLLNISMDEVNISMLHKLDIMSLLTELYNKYIINMDNNKASPILARGVSLIFRILLYKSINVSCHMHDNSDNEVSAFVTNIISQYNKWFNELSGKLINESPANYCKIDNIYGSEMIENSLECDNNNCFTFELIIPYEMYDKCEWIQKENKLTIKKLKEFMVNKNKVLSIEVKVENTDEMLKYFYNWKLKIRCLLGLTVNDLININNDKYQSKESYLKLNDNDEDKYEKYVIQCVNDKLDQNNKITLCAKYRGLGTYGIIDGIESSTIKFLCCAADETGEIKKYSARDIELIDYIYSDTISTFTFKNGKDMPYGITSIHSYNVNLIDKLSKFQSNNMTNNNFYNTNCLCASLNDVLYVLYRCCRTKSIKYYSNNFDYKHLYSTCVGLSNKLINSYTNAQVVQYLSIHLLRELDISFNYTFDEYENILLNTCQIVTEPYSQEDLIPPLHTKGWFHCVYEKKPKNMSCKIYNHCVIKKASFIEYNQKEADVKDDQHKIKIHKWIGEADESEYRSKNDNMKIIRSENKIFVHIAHPKASSLKYTEHSTIPLSEFYWHNSYYFKYNYGYRSYIKLYRNLCLKTDVQWMDKNNPTNILIHKLEILLNNLKNGTIQNNLKNDINQSIINQAVLILKILSTDRGFDKSLLCEGNVIKFKNKRYTIRNVSIQPHERVKIHCESLISGAEELITLPLKEVVIESEWNQQHRHFINKMDTQLLSKFINVLHGLLTFEWRVIFDEKHDDEKTDNKLSIIHENILLQIHRRCLNCLSNCLKAKQFRVQLFKLNLWNKLAIKFAMIGIKKITNNEKYNSLDNTLTKAENLWFEQPVKQKNMSFNINEQDVKDEVKENKNKDINADDSSDESDSDWDSDADKESAKSSVFVNIFQDNNDSDSDSDSDSDVEEKKDEKKDDNKPEEYDKDDDSQPEIIMFSDSEEDMDEDINDNQNVELKENEFIYLNKNGKRSKMCDDEFEQKDILMQIEYKYCKEFMDTLDEKNSFDEIWLLNTSRFTHVKTFCEYKIGVSINWINIETMDGILIENQDVFNEIKDRYKRNKIEIFKLVCKPNEYKRDCLLSKQTAVPNMLFINGRDIISNVECKTNEQMIEVNDIHKSLGDVYDSKLLPQGLKMNESMKKKSGYNVMYLVFDASKGDCKLFQCDFFSIYFVCSNESKEIVIEYKDETEKKQKRIRNMDTIQFEEFVKRYRFCSILCAFSLKRKKLVIRSDVITQKKLKAIKFNVKGSYKDEKNIFNKCAYNQNVKILSYWKNVKYHSVLHIIDNNKFYGICQILNERILLAEKLNNINITTNKNKIGLEINKLELIATNQWYLNIVFDMKINNNCAEIKFYNENNECKLTLKMDENDEKNKLLLNKFNRICIVGRFNMNTSQNNYVCMYINAIKYLSMDASNIKKPFTKMVINNTNNEINVKQYYCEQLSNAQIKNERGNKDIYKLYNNEEYASKVDAIIQKKKQELEEKQKEEEKEIDSKSITIKVGSSSTNTKSVILPHENMTVSATPVNHQNPGWNDRFSVKVTDKNLVVTRLDSSGGWGQDLVLKAVPKKKEISKEEQKTQRKQLKQEIKKLNKLYGVEERYEYESFGWNIGDINLLGSSINPHLIDSLPKYNLMELIELFIPLYDIKYNTQLELVNRFMIIVMNNENYVNGLKYLDDFMNGFILSVEMLEDNKKKESNKKMVEMMSYLGYDIDNEFVLNKLNENNGNWKKTIEELRNNNLSNRNMVDLKYPLQDVIYATGVNIVISGTKIYNKTSKWIEDNINANKEGVLKLSDLKYNYKEFTYLTETELNKEINESEAALKILFARECCLRIIRSITKSKDLSSLFSEISRNVLDSFEYNQEIQNNDNTSHIDVFTLILKYILSDVHSTNVFESIKSIQNIVTNEFKDLINYGKYNEWKSIVFIGKQIYELFQDNVIIVFEYYVINGNKENNKNVINSLNILNTCFRILYLSLKKSFNNDLKKASTIPIIDPMIVTWLFEVMFVLNNENNLKLNLIKLLLNIIKLCMPKTNWILFKLKKLLQLTQQQDAGKDKTSKTYGSCLPCLINLYISVRENIINDKKDDEKQEEKEQNIKENQLLIPFKLNSIDADINNLKKDGLLMWLYKQQIQLQEMEHKSSELDEKTEIIESIEIKVGSSSTNTKYVVLPHENMTVSSTPVNPQDSGWNDTFSVKVTDKNLVVTRTDASDGWGQDLVLKAVPKKKEQERFNDTDIVDSGLIKCSYSSKHFNNSNYWRYAVYHKCFWNTNDAYRFDGILTDCSNTKEDEPYFEIQLMSHLIQPIYYRFRGGDKNANYSEKDCNQMQLISWKLMAFDVIKNAWITIDKKSISLSDETINGKTHRLYKLSFPVLNKIKSSFFKKFRIIQTGKSSTGDNKKFKIQSIDFYGSIYPLYEINNIKNKALDKQSHYFMDDILNERKEIELSKILNDESMEEWMLKVDRFYYITLYLHNEIKNDTNKRIIEFFENAMKLFSIKYGENMNEFINLCMKNEQNINSNHKIDKYLISYVNNICVDKKLELNVRESFADIINKHFVDIKVLIKELDIEIDNNKMTENKLIKYCIGRMSVIFEYNQLFLTIEDHLDTYSNNNEGLNRLINKNMISQLIFTSIKLIKWNKILDSIRDGSQNGKFPVDRFKADNFKCLNEIDYFGKFTAFGQIYNQLKLRTSSNFRVGQNTRLFTVKLPGENAIDAGGPYREVFEYFMSELFATKQILPLFKLCPNGEHDIGLNRDCFIPENILYSDSAIAGSQFEMFEMIGKLIGTSMRSKHYLIFLFPPIIWKLICGQQLILDDINDIDEFSYKLLLNMQSNEKNLKNISQILHKFDKQIELIRSGLSVVIPVSYLKLFNWYEVEEMVCGPKKLNIELLKKMSYYDGFDENDKWIIWLWEIIENELNEKEIQYLLMFCWGRKRLPANEKEFDSKFKISHKHSSKTQKEIDQLLPTAATCYFQLKIPKYSNKDIMKKRLLYASIHCSSIDLD